MRRLLLASQLFLLGLCSGFAQDVTVYAIGDAGAPHSPIDATLDYLREISGKGNAQDVLLFLGDDLYPKGLPDKEAPNREEMEAALDKSLEIMKAFKGRSIMVPGNHDWANGRKAGWKQVINMQEYVDAYMGAPTVFLPRGGCPGPIEIEISPEILLLIMDTQYLLHPWDKPDQEDGCEAQSSADAIALLDDLLGRNKDRHVIVAGHHPMYSYGPHGGNYTFRQHLFPLTDVNRKLWIPLPVIGSIYPLFKSVFGSRQDITNPRYKQIRNAMVKSFGQVDHLVYLSGHEHSLQYIRRDSAHYIVSGSGTKSSNVKAGKGTQFFKETKGFASLTYSGNQPVNLKFYDGDAQKTIYDNSIFTKKLIPQQSSTGQSAIAESTILAPISDRYIHPDSRNRTYWLGGNYREVWATPVEMRVFDIDKEQGGLEILKLGGGNQTKSLRLEAKDGRQYVLRSLDKYTDKLLPSALQHTLASDILQDQISAANPFGAFAIPPLADAAGIYHTNPELVYIADDPRFGKYQAIFANLPVVFEERPTTEMAEESFFGNGEKIAGTPDVIERIQKDNDETVDQPFALRNRLFDMVIGDWDRHEDQWRWVRTDKEPSGHLWRPIPRDRDQAFFVNEGLFGWVASRKYALPNTEGFDEYMNYPPGFNKSGRFFDRTFLNELDWSDWKIQIEDLQNKLSDEAVAAAFKVWPDTIQRQVADETARVLKARRDDMLRFARIHYLFLSEQVEIVGSNKHEYFLIERLSDLETKVTVYKRKKDGELEQIIYQRTFLNEETEEIRLYGLEGEDVFDIEGKVSKGIRVRIIGGEDEDVITDHSEVKGLGKKTVVYDLTNNTTLLSSSETKSRLSNSSEINSYNRTAFEYNNFMPLVSFQFNPDDGLFLGAGFTFTKEGWRKDPFAYQHSLKANVALETGAINLYYEGTLTDVIGKWDLHADVTVQRPYGVANFFGMGNESTYDYKGRGESGNFEDEIDYYRIRYERIQAYINLTYNLGQKGLLRIGPELLTFELGEEVTNKYINDPTNGLDPATLYNSHQYIGFKTEIQADTRDHPNLPSQGVFAQMAYANYHSVSNTAKDFATLSGEFQFLLSTRIPSRLTMANKIGAQYNLGDVTYFNGAYLGKETIRGYRRTRFIGDASLYHNLDLRLHLFSFKTYLLPAGVGLIAFHDVGRVWLDGEQSSSWHASKGFGLWLAPLNQFVFAFNLAFTDEETLPTVTFGYQF
jgi:hypothetical protein